MADKPITQVEHLPNGWIEVPLGEIVSNIQSGFASGKHNQLGQGIPHLRPMNVSATGKLELSVLKFIEIENYPNLLPNDILFNNTNSAELVGKTTVIREHINATFSNHMTRIRIVDGFVNPFFVAYYLLHLFHSRFFQNNSTKHVNQASINNDFLKRQNIPLPPLDEQNRIVSIVEEKVKELEDIKKVLEDIPLLLKIYRQTVISLGVKGKLLDVNISDPKFSVVKLSDLLREKLQNGYSPTSVGFKTPYKVLTLTATTSGVFNPSHFKYFNEPIPSDSTYWLKEGDILIQRGNTREYVGMPAIFEGKSNEFIFPDLMIRIRVNELIDIKYLYFYLLSDDARNFFKERATGTAGNMPKINQTILEEFQLEIPSIDVQLEIVKQIESYLSITVDLEKDYAEAQTLLKELPQQLLEQAFSGKLTDQDPNDEPASTLMERIRIQLDSLKEQSKTAVKQKRKMATTQKSKTKNLAEAIVQNFSDNAFTFEELASTLSEWGYEDLKDDVFNLLKINKLAMNFDQSKESLTFKLSGHDD